MLSPMNKDHYYLADKLSDKTVTDATNFVAYKLPVDGILQFLHIIVEEKLIRNSEQIRDTDINHLRG
jgi:hypothetical protein